MEDFFSKTDELVDDLKDYVDVKMDSMKLSLAEKSSKLLSNFIAGIIVAVIMVFFVIFLSIAAAYLIGESLGNMWMGFLIVAGFYFFLAFIVWAGRERIIRIPIMNSILSQLTKKEDYDEEN